MTLQEIMQAAQGLSWQDQLHLATRLLQWAEAAVASAEPLEPPPTPQPGAAPLPLLTSLPVYPISGSFGQAQAAIAAAQQRYAGRTFSDSTDLIREDRDR
jgi:hypothetical protein